MCDSAEVTDADAHARATDAADAADADAGLLARWSALFPDVGADADAAVQSCGRSLLASYREADRRYHSVAHLRDVLDRIDALVADGVLGGDPASVRLVQLAAWFHDAVYDPTSPGNEAASATLAVTELHALGVDEASVAEVARLVTLTAGHHVGEGDERGALLVDADLAILSAPPTHYDRYVAEVRAEYAHVPDDGWRIGRAGVLTHLLAADRLARCGPDADRRDAAARANLRRELDALGVVADASD